MNKEQGELWQPIVGCKFPYKQGLFRKKVTITLTFVCDKVFIDKESAVLYFPKFIQDLIAKDIIPKEAVVNGQINEEMVVTLVQKVTVAAVEYDREEFTGRNDIR